MQVNVYKKVNNDLVYLAMKRTEEEGGFWQPITGTVDEGETLLDTMTRELNEEAGITSLLAVSPELHSYSWTWKQEGTGTDHVFACEVLNDTEIVLNPSEHNEFRWVSKDEMMELLRWDGNKVSLDKVHEYLLRL